MSKEKHLATSTVKTLKHFGLYLFLLLGVPFLLGYFYFGSLEKPLQLFTEADWTFYLALLGVFLGLFSYYFLKAPKGEEFSF